MKLKAAPYLPCRLKKTGESNARNSPFIYVLANPVKHELLTRDLIFPPSCWLQFLLMFFSLLLSCFFPPYLFHHFSTARIPPGCVWLHLAVGREEEEESQRFSPSGSCFDFSKVTGSRLLSAYRWVSRSCHPSSVSTSQLTPLLFLTRAAMSLCSCCFFKQVEHAAVIKVSGCSGGR